MRRWESSRRLRSRIRQRGGGRASKGRHSIELGLRSPREVPLVEISSLGDQGTLSDRVVEFPALVASRIAYEDAFFVVRLKRSPLISLYMHIGSAPPYLEV